MEGEKGLGRKSINLKRLHPSSVRYCPHCDKEVSYSVYKRHKDMFYNYCNKEWIKSALYQNLDDEDDKVIHDAINTKGIVIVILLE